MEETAFAKSHTALTYWREVDKLFILKVCQWQKASWKQDVYTVGRCLFFDWQVETATLLSLFIAITQNKCLSVEVQKGSCTGFV